MVLQRFVRQVAFGVRRMSSIPSSTRPSPDAQNVPPVPSFNNKLFVKRGSGEFLEVPPKKYSALNWVVHSLSKLVGALMSEHQHPEPALMEETSHKQPGDFMERIRANMNRSEPAIINSLRDLMVVLQAWSEIKRSRLAGLPQRTLLVRASTYTEEASIRSAMMSFGPVSHFEKIKSTDSALIFLVQFSQLSCAQEAAKVYAKKSHRHTFGTKYLAHLPNPDILRISYSLPCPRQLPTSCVEMKVPMMCVDSITGRNKEFERLLQLWPGYLRREPAKLIAMQLLEAMGIKQAPVRAIIAVRRSVIIILIELSSTRDAMDILNTAQFFHGPPLFFVGARYWDPGSVNQPNIAAILRSLAQETKTGEGKIICHS
ncbi:hypothetical protein C8J56DRAFT_970807 [Mycena floridula]|nr:hypothetical protein C8J56DRAFT_970807 [Mycena floridula]